MKYLRAVCWHIQVKPRFLQCRAASVESLRAEQIDHGPFVAGQVFGGQLHGTLARMRGEIDHGQVELGGSGLPLDDYKIFRSRVAIPRASRLEQFWTAS